MSLPGDTTASPEELSVSSGGSDGSQTETWAEYENLPHFVVYTYFRHIPEQYDRDDMVQDAWMALLEWLQEPGLKDPWKACSVMRKAIYTGLRTLDSRDLHIPEGYEDHKYPDPSLVEVDLDILDDDERWAIRMHYLEGMRQSEVASAMRKSKNQVKWIIQRSLDKLRSAS